MVLVTANKCQRLLCLSYVRRVAPAEVQKVQEELKILLADLSPGFRLLVDLSEVEFMEAECLTEIGRTMDAIDQRGVGLIVRIIPDTAKDIGLNILTIFHYPHHPRIITCRDMGEALAQLSRW